MLKNIFSKFAKYSPISGRRPCSLTIGDLVIVAATVLAVNAYCIDSGAAPLTRDISGLAKSSPGICGTAIPLSDLSCKKDADKNLEIGANGCGPSVYVDKNFIGADHFNAITIDSSSTLCFPDQTVKMDLGTLLVNGLLQIGQKTHPIGTTDPLTLITLDFVGKRPCAAGTNCPNFSKGIQVQSGGSLEMYGQKGVPPNGLNWTYLSQPAGPPKEYGKGSGVTQPVGTDGAETLRVADDVAQGMGRDDKMGVARAHPSPRRRDQGKSIYREHSCCR
jgi:hypothetical protein